MVDAGQIPDFLKDVASQGALVYTVTQIVKDMLMRWLGEFDAQATRGIALMFSIFVAAGVTPADPVYMHWLLTVVGYGTVVLLPVALAGHVVAGLGDPRPEVATQRKAARAAKSGNGDVKTGDVR